MDDRLHPIGDVARAFGMAVSALRYYDEVGLLAPASRRGDVRYYGAAECRRLAMITMLRQRGRLTVAQTADVLAGSDAGWRDSVTAALGRLENEIAHLRTAVSFLHHTLDCPRADPEHDCPVLTELVPAELA